MFIDVQAAKDTANKVLQVDQLDDFKRRVTDEITEAAERGKFFVIISFEYTYYSSYKFQDYAESVKEIVVRDLISSGYEAKITWTGKIKISWKSAKGIIQPKMVEQRLKGKGAK